MFSKRFWHPKPLFNYSAQDLYTKPRIILALTLICILDILRPTGEDPRETEFFLTKHSNAVKLSLRRTLVRSVLYTADVVLA